MRSIPQALALLLLALPAAADDAPPERERKHLAWDCERLDVVTSQETVERLRVFLPDRTVELPLVPSGSGARYQG